ncbi:hypothetical protein ACFQYP_50600 [Nonomuraea antimicrobica]
MLRKVINTVLIKVDSLAISAVASAVTQTVDADTYGGAWNSSAANVLRTLEIAKAFLVDLDMGYEADTLLLSSEMYAIMVSDEKVNNLRRRETLDNPIYGGEVEMIDDLVVVKAPPAASRAAMCGCSIRASWVGWPTRSGPTPATCRPRTASRSRPSGSHEPTLGTSGRGVRRYP